ncbi:uncharacterized protein si:cabz01007807.1 isoform X2 [Sebastes umbrosus]|uniref:uncharacterized protein si:cabz01007807.1 isoform X2 n=1 Tax=Sebastes umbrosus TaxID=72105 RepID=UPI00189D0A3A|nr:uncharacterized protein si:cabz01007807.1 isoform X2 [Sebastes umbrosus]
MRGDTTTENEVEEDDHGGSEAAATETASGERRPDGAFLPGLSAAAADDAAAAATDVMDNHQLHTGRQNGGQEVLHLNPQSGVNGDLARMNPFYTNNLESSSRGHVIEDVGRRTPEAVNLDTIAVPPPEFPSSLDLQPEMKTLTPNQNSTDLFQPMFKDDGVDLFQATEGEDLLHAENTMVGNPFVRSSSIFVDPLNSSSNKEDDLFRSTQPVMANPLYTTTTKEADLPRADPTKSEDLFHKQEDLFGMSSFQDAFSSSSTNAVDPFPSPITRDLFQDVSSLDDPFGTTPTRHYNPFHDFSPGTTDIFKPLPPKTNGTDVFGITSSDTPKATYFTPSLNSPSEMKLDAPLEPTDLFKATPSESESPDDLFLPTPQGTKPDIPQPSPFSRARNLSMMHGQSQADRIHGGPTFKRPPKPRPRSRPPRPEKPAKPASPTEPEATVPKTYPKPPLRPLPKPASPTEPEATVPKTYPKPPLRPLPKPASPTEPEATVPKTYPKPPLRPLPKPASPTEPEATVPKTYPKPPLRPLPKPASPTEPEATVPKTYPKPPLRPLPKPASPIEPEATVAKHSPKPPLRTLSKPVLHHNPEPTEGKLLEAEKSPVFENVLLIGQERCVEDWPEDSPELNPDFKPAGTLRLRRESFKLKLDSDGGSGEDQSDAKKDRKFRLSLLSRRDSKEKFPDDRRRSSTLPNSRRSSKEQFSEVSEEKNEDWEQNGTDNYKNHLKTRVGQLSRASTFSALPVGKYSNGEESKGDDINKKGVGNKNSMMRQFSEGAAVNVSTGEDEEEEEGGEAQHEDGFKKRKKKVKIRFVPQRGFAITVEKKGAHGYTPRKSTKEKSPDEFLGAHGYTPSKKYQDDVFEDEKEKGHSPASPTSKAAFMDDEPFQKTHHRSVGLNRHEDLHAIEDGELRKPTKKPLPMGHRSSKEDLLDDTDYQKKKSSFSAEELYDEDWMDDCKPKTSKQKGPTPMPRKSKTANGQSEPVGFSHQTPQHAANVFNDPFAEDDFTEKGKHFTSPEEMYDSEEDEEETCEPKKSSKFKGFKKHKAKESKAMQPEWEDPPGATSSDFMSEAAQAEWLAAQKDERAMAGMEDEDEDGDTDSLMEWWHTVEKWDEVPSDNEDQVMREDESKSFSILAEKVYRGMRLFNKVFTERAEDLWQSVISLHAIADNINNFHHKAKIAGITGGTTTAVGGVTAIAGLALAPFTLGVSLVITAVGVGVATAGGIASASAAISDNVNNMHDRKKVEIVLQQYEGHLKAIGKILHFVNQGVYKLRGHPFLRSGTQHYSKDWETRRTVQMISLVDTPVLRGTEITDESLASVQGLFRGIDKYFIKDSRELKKGCKKEVVGEIKEVANVLNDGIVELNAIREELQDATGNL